jgi:hypothetical protein
MSRYEYYPVPEGKDPYLWRKAQMRAAFKAHALAFVLVNVFLVGVWYFTGPYAGRDVYFWPVWPLLGWGIGLASHGFAAYSSGAENAVEREYRKLSEK